MDPYEANIFEVNDLQEFFSDLQTDLELKVNISKERYESFWTQQNLRQTYPIILEEVKLLFIAFPSSDLLGKILSKRYNLDIYKEGDMRIYLTDLEPDIEKLASSHPSH